MLNVYKANINEDATYVTTSEDFNNGLGLWQIHTWP